jgi:hypothetical protein
MTESVAYKNWKLIAGIVILGLGLFVLLRGASFTSRRDVLKVGDLKVTATEEQSIPPWVGGAAMVAGLALIVTGARKRTT